MNRRDEIAEARLAVSGADTWRRAAQARSERRLLPGDAGERLGCLVDRVKALSPRLVDAWEATALVESLGYTDQRIRAEFGLSDTRLAGEHVFRLAADDDTRHEPAPRGTDVRPGIASGLLALARLYGAAWLVVLAADWFQIDVGLPLGDFDVPALLVAAGGAAVSWALFARDCMREAARPYFERGAEFVAVLRRHHDRTVGFTAGACALAAALAGALGGVSFRGALPSHLTWPVTLLHAGACAGLAVGLLNALVLLDVRRPLTAACAFAPALAINVAWRYGLVPSATGWLAFCGWPATAACAAAASTFAVRRRLIRFDYAYAVVSRRTAAVAHTPAIDQTEAGFSNLVLRAETR